MGRAVASRAQGASSQADSAGLYRLYMTALNAERPTAGVRRGMDWTPGQPPDGAVRVKRFPLVRAPAISSHRPAAAARSAFTRSDSARFVAIDAAMTPMVTIAIMMVQTALISGFTPSRTEE